MSLSCLLQAAWYFLASTGKQCDPTRALVPTFLSTLYPNVYSTQWSFVHQSVRARPLVSLLGDGCSMGTPQRERDKKQAGELGDGGIGEIVNTKNVCAR